MRLSAFRIVDEWRGLKVLGLTELELPVSEVLARHLVSEHERLPSDRRAARKGPRLAPVAPMRFRGSGNVEKSVEHGLLHVLEPVALADFLAMRFLPGDTDGELDVLVRRLRADTSTPRDLRAALRDRFARAGVTRRHLAEGRHRSLSDGLPVLLADEDNDATVRLERPQGTFLLHRGSSVTLVVDRDVMIRGVPVPRRQWAVVADGCPVLHWDGARTRLFGDARGLPDAFLEAADAIGAVHDFTSDVALEARDLRARFVLRVPPPEVIREAIERPPPRGVLDDAALLFDSRHTMSLPDDLPVFDDPGVVRWVMARSREGVYVPGPSGGELAVRALPPCLVGALPGLDA